MAEEATTGAPPPVPPTPPLGSGPAGEPSRGPASKEARVEGPELVPLHAAFAGVLEGPLGDRAQLERAAAELRAVAPFQSDLDVDAGRFSLLVTDGAVSGDAMGAALRADLLERLNAVVQSSDPARVESTLRCTLYFEAEVVEILFRVTAGELVDVARRRPTSADDDRALAELTVAPFDPKPPHAGLLLALVALVVGGIAWESGVIGAVGAPPIEELRLETGPFGNTLALEAISEPLRYRVRLTRGPQYPATAEATELLREALPSNADRLALSSVTSGQRIYVRLVDSDELTLATAPLDLRALVLDPDAFVAAEFAAVRGAAEIRLDLLPQGTR